jgi:hypothetical protein
VAKSIGKSSELRQKLDRAEAHCADYESRLQAEREHTGQVEGELAKLREEVALDDKLLADRDRLLDELKCAVHGRCLPGALEHVWNMQQRLQDMGSGLAKLRQLEKAARLVREAHRCRNSEKRAKARIDLYFALDALDAHREQGGCDGSGAARSSYPNYDAEDCPSCDGTGTTDTWWMSADVGPQAYGAGAAAAVICYQCGARFELRPGEKPGDACPSCGPGKPAERGAGGESDGIKDREGTSGDTRDDGAAEAGGPMRMLRRETGQGGPVPEHVVRLPTGAEGQAQQAEEVVTSASAGAAAVPECVERLRALDVELLRAMLRELAGPEPLVLLDSVRETDCLEYLATATPGAVVAADDVVGAVRTSVAKDEKTSVTE